jgi:hypothetical protein
MAVVFPSPYKFMYPSHRCKQLQEMKKRKQKYPPLSLDTNLGRGGYVFSICMIRVQIT